MIRKDLLEIYYLRRRFCCPLQVVCSPPSLMVHEDCSLRKMLKMILSDVFLRPCRPLLRASWTTCGPWTTGWEPVASYVNVLRKWGIKLSSHEASVAWLASQYPSACERVAAFFKLSWQRDSQPTAESGICLWDVSAGLPPMIMVCFDRLACFSHPEQFRHCRINLMHRVALIIYHFHITFLNYRFT